VEFCDSRDHLFNLKAQGHSVTGGFFVLKAGVVAAYFAYLSVTVFRPDMVYCFFSDDHHF
jgi:hypothetical protein